MGKNGKPVKTRKQATTRQRKFVRGLVEGKSQRSAARDAGYAEATAASSDKILKKPVVKELLDEAMAEAGITIDLVAARMREGLDATVVARETQFAGREVLIDFKERREMVGLIAKLKGLVIEQHEVKVTDLANVLAASFG